MPEKAASNSRQADSERGTRVHVARGAELRRDVRQRNALGAELAVAMDKGAQGLRSGVAGLGLAGLSPLVADGRGAGAGAAAGGAAGGGSTSGPLMPQPAAASSAAATAAIRKCRNIGVNPITRNL